MHPCPCTPESHVETLIIYKLGFVQNYYTFALILLIKIVMCKNNPQTNFINYKCFEMKSGECLELMAAPSEQEFILYAVKV